VKHKFTVMSFSHTHIEFNIEIAILSKEGLSLQKWTFYEQEFKDGEFQ
jgi:hypothetical protein